MIVAVSSATHPVGIYQKPPPREDVGKGRTITTQRGGVVHRRRLALPILAGRQTEIARGVRWCLEPTYDTKVIAHSSEFDDLLQRSRVGMVLEVPGWQPRFLRPPLIHLFWSDRPLPYSRSPSIHTSMPLRGAEIELPRAVTAAVVEEVMMRTRDLMLRRRDLHRCRHLRGALNAALNPDPERRPPTSVQGLARLSRCNVRTLQSEWRRLVGASHRSPTLKDVLATTMLLRAIRIRFRGPRPAWTAVARKVGVSSRTLRDQMASRFGVTPGRLTVDSIPPLLAEAEDAVLGFLSGSHPSTP